MIPIRICYHAAEVAIPLFLIGVASPQPAYAYLDPSGGSVLLQVMAGALFTGLAVIKIYWKKLLALFQKKKVE